MGAGEEGNDRATFHPALLEHFDGCGKQIEAGGLESLAVDLSEHGLSIAGVKLAAGVLGVAYDDLNSVSGARSCVTAVCWPGSLPWCSWRVEDGSLVMELTGADAVDLDTEFFFVSRQEGAEIRRLDDGSLVLPLGDRATGASYPGPGLVQVRLGDDSRELRRLLDVLDLGWLERATVDGITAERLFALACEGPLAGFDAAVLDERLGGDTWSGCVGIHL